VTVNDPAVMRTIAALHDGYEAALAANDAAALNHFFVDSPRIVRPGLAEQVYGVDEARARGGVSTPLAQGRRVVHREIVTVGTAVATVTTEFEMPVDGARRRGRQSQTWVHAPPDGWRIVAMQTSMCSPSPADSPWRRYADMLAGSLGLTLDEPRHALYAASRDATVAPPAPARPDQQAAPVLSA
jgi:hypothetical protein